MGVRYFRINRAAYTAGELSAITVGRRRLILPALIVRLFVLKLLGKTVPVGDPIAEARLIAPLDHLEAAEIRERHAFFRKVEPALARLGFTEICYHRADDPRYPYQSFNLQAVDPSGSIAVGCTVMGNAKFLVDWIEFYSLLVDGRTLRSHNHPLAGALRPPPSAIIRRMPGAESQELFQFHSDELKRMRSSGSRFVEGMNVDHAVQADRDYYRDQIAHWIETGLVIPDRGNQAG
jgi:hypothetical protein